MVFSSLFFLYGFLPVCVLLYALTPGIGRKNIVLIFLSLAFYAWGEPIWVVLLLFSATQDYFCGRVIGRARRVGSERLAKGALIFSIATNLTLLGVFKYLDFFLYNMGLAFNVTPTLPGIALPIGISFYTFQTMSYTIDVYRGKVNVQKSFTDFLLFVSLFPPLIAGPILRYSELEKQLRNRLFTWEGCAEGITRFCCGLGKKVLLANTTGEIASGLLDGRLYTLPAADALLGILMFTAQIYFDFSGYSDMAIGLGKIFGFKYGENFRYPYYAKSIGDFWRRWHISLGAFFRDYVYIPLGGNRKRVIVSLTVTWFLTGLWHGASWNFVIWGLYFALWLAFERWGLPRFPRKIAGVLPMIYTFPAVVLGWVIFYFTDFARLVEFLRSLLGYNGFAGTETFTFWLGRFPLILICVAAASPKPKIWAERLINKGSSLYPTLSLCYNSVLLLLSTAFLAGQTFNPFIYFRF
ncbi:MAG: MBOAT family protein [Defluviitaleaceae bacterium]|nr:MBOAT family protein [Defluviitaleaceae bacterium]